MIQIGKLRQLKIHIHLTRTEQQAEWNTAVGIHSPPAIGVLRVCLAQPYCWHLDANNRRPRRRPAVARGGRPGRPRAARRGGRRRRGRARGPSTGPCVSADPRGQGPLVEVAHQVDGVAVDEVAHPVARVCRGTSSPATSRSVPSVGAGPPVGVKSAKTPAGRERSSSVVQVPSGGHRRGGRVGSR